MKGKKIFLTIFYLLAIVLIIILIGVLGLGYYKKQNLNVQNPIVTMEVENFGTVKIELYPDIAPEAVKNFIALAKGGFYDGLKFHRVVKDFMIQGGDPTGDGTGSPRLSALYPDEDSNKTYKYEDGTEAKRSDEYSITGEFVANGYKNNILNLTEGVVAMARSDYTSSSPTLTTESYNSAGSQFFIMTTNDHTGISGYYAGFGKVIDGMDVVKKISEVECKAEEKDEDEEESSDEEKSDETEKEDEEETSDESSESEEEDEEESHKAESEEGEVSIPVEDVRIKTLTVDTFGIDYGLPKILPPFDYSTWLSEMYGM